MNNLFQGIDTRFVVTLKTEEELARERRKTIINEIFTVCNASLIKAHKTQWAYPRYTMRCAGMTKIEELDSFWEDCKKQRDPCFYFFAKTKVIKK